MSHGRPTLRIADHVGSAALRQRIGRGFWLWSVAVSLLLLACGPTIRPFVDATKQQAPAQPHVLVVTLTGVLGTQELALCHRALREAAAGGLGVVFLMRDAGGDAESAADTQALLDHIENARARVATTAVLSGHVRGGAAYAALLCDQMVFLQHGDLGSITPMPTLLEQVKELTVDDAERQRWRAYAGELRTRLERRKEKLGSDTMRLCEGMADPGLQLVRLRLRERGVETTRIVDVTEITGLQAAGVVIQDQEKVTRPVVLDAQQAEALRLSQGTVSSLDQLCSDVLRTDRSLVVELQYSWAEHMVGWLELLQPGLLVLGLVLLILELKTPGIGLPGFLGASFLALALFYDYLVGLAEITEILLFFLGLLAIGVEIFLLPGMVVFGAVGFLCLVFSLILSRQTFVLPSTLTEQEILFHNLVQLTLLFVAVLVFASVMWRVLPYIPVLNKMYLPAPEPVPTGGGDRAELQRLQALVGKVGRAATVLRPAGAVEFDGERVDVVTDGSFVEPGTSVRVIAVAGNRVVVERVDGAETGSVGAVLLLALVGLLLIVAEVFFMSFGVLALLSGGALIGAVFLAFQDSGAFGTTMLIGEAIGAPVVVWAAFKALPLTPFGKALMLQGPRHEDVTAPMAGAGELLHKAGVALSPLRPAGFARIGDRRVDVVTRGEMIEQGAAVRVVEVLGNKVVVRLDAADVGSHGTTNKAREA